MIRCPGCGGRNDANARVCEWCERPFVAERGQPSLIWLLPATGLTLALLVILATVLVVANLRPTTTGGGPQLAPLTDATPIPNDEPTGLDEPESTVLPTVPTATVAVSAATSAPADVEFVRIANTGGEGAFIRREPRAGAPGIIAHREGTVLRVVGADVTVDGRPWREVEDARGNRGWTPRQYLAPSPTGF